MTDLALAHAQKAREELSRYRYPQALHEAEIALAELERGKGDENLQAELHELAGEAALGLSDHPIAEEHLRSASELLDKLGENRRTLACRLGLAELSMRQGNLRRARHVSTTALMKATEEQWDDLIARALFCLGSVAWKESDSQPAVDYLEKALALYKKLDAAAQISRVRTSLGVAYLLDERKEEARSMFESSLQYFQQEGDLVQVIRCLNNLAGIAYASSDFERAREYLLQCVDMETEIQAKGDLTLSRFNLGLIEMREGNLKLAKKYLNRAFQMAQEVGDRNSEGAALMQLGIVSLLENDPEEALNYGLLGMAKLEGSSSANARMARYYVPIMHLANNNEEAARKAWALPEDSDLRDELSSLADLLAHLASPQYVPVEPLTPSAQQLALEWGASLRERLNSGYQD